MRGGSLIVVEMAGSVSPAIKTYRWGLILDHQGQDLVRYVNVLFYADDDL